jgi:ComF family protein
VRRGFRELAAGVLDAACPPHCPACGEASAGLCARCAAGLAVMRAPVCPRCGEPVLSAGAPCPFDHRRLRGIARAWAPFRFRGTGGAIVRRLKFEHDPSGARLLGRAMADVLRPWVAGAARRAVVVSVPLHPRKRRQRGLDQAAALAQGVAARVGLRFVPAALARVRETLPQGDPRVTSRARNVRGAFAVRKPGRLRGRIVVLVDDVFTSGQTARECARVLRAAGARQVVMLAATRA